MSRVDDGYEPDSVEDELRSWAFQGNMDRSLAGKKGQKFLRELEAALVALPVKRLSKGALAACRDVDSPKVYEPTGDVCALGAVAVGRAVAAGKTREQALEEIALKFHPENFCTGWELTGEEAHLLKICHPLAFAVASENDECCVATPEARYEKVLAWVRSNLKS